MSSELVPSFDTCYLFPLPKFVTELKYEDEVKKVSRELLTIYVKNRVKEISDEIKITENSKNPNEAERLKKEFTKLLSLLPKN